MVFVPRQPWKSAWYGGDGGVPRAVPSDALVSLATRLVPGDLLQAAVLVGIPLVAGAGVLRLTRRWHPAAGVAALTLYVWNPYVDERLGIGHWALLCGYAALPWVVLAARAAARGDRMGWWALLPTVGLAAATSPSGGLMATALAIGTLLVSGGLRRALVGLAAGVVVNLPWLVPAILAVPGTPADPFGAEAFAARADTPWGLLASLATFGGLWKSSVISPLRADPVLSLVALLLTGVGIAGSLVARRRPEARLFVSVAVVAVPMLLGAWVLSSWGSPWARWLIVHVPGGGVLRDTQKWVAPFCLFVSLGVGYAVDRLAPWLAGRRLVWSAFGVALLPALLLPTLAWGRLGEWQPTAYPPEWGDVAGTLEAASAPEDRLVVLPFTIYRRFAWNAETAVLDPAPRFFPGTVITDDELGVADDRAVGGESSLAARIRAVSGDSPSLAALLEAEGIRWVLEEKGTPGEGTLPSGAGTVIHDGPELRLIELPTSDRSDPFPASAGWSTPLLILDAVVLGLVAIAAVRAAALILRRRASPPAAARQGR